VFEEYLVHELQLNISFIGVFPGKYKIDRSYVSNTNYVLTLASGVSFNFNCDRLLNLINSKLKPNY
jgi:hypothetical protein